MQIALLKCARTWTAAGASVLPYDDVRASRSVCVCPRAARAQSYRLPRGGGAVKVSQAREVSFTAGIQKLTPFSRVCVKRNTGLLPWNDSASPGAKTTRWRPVSRRGSDSPLCSACAAVFWRNVKVFPGDIRTRTWLAEVAGKSWKGHFLLPASWSDIYIKKIRRGGKEKSQGCTKSRSET